MNCRKLKSNCENMAANGEFPRLSSEAERHLVTCASCRGFVETRKEICAGLRTLRERAPKIPASLDERVLAGYREQMVLQKSVRRGSQWRIAAFWPIAAAAVALVISASLLVSRPHQAINSQVQPAPVQQVVPASQSQTKENAHITRKEKRVAVAAKQRPHVPGEERLSAPAPAMMPVNSQEFRSLMYCDELSCDGGMDVVRVELPSLLPELPGTSRGPRTISADVLVGADGFARGIRIVN